MAKVITPHMMRKQLFEVQQQSSNPQNISGLSTTTTITSNGSTVIHENNKETIIQNTPGFTLVSKKIVKVQADTLIAEDNTKYKLFNPLPGVYWTCTGYVDSHGICVLEEPITALTLSDGTNNYVLGVEGATKEFELRFVADGTEVVMNKDFLSVKTPHLIKQGLEEKSE